MKKEIDLFKLQNIVDIPMQNEIRFRCRGCNKPFKSIIDAYTCDCKKNKEKKVAWTAGKHKKFNW